MQPKMLFALVFLAGAAAVRAASDVGPRVTLPFNEVDTLDGAKFKIRVPANWNGTLLLHLRGPNVESAPPEPALTPAVLPGSEPALEETLITRGYALAASQIANLDMGVKESVQDHFALATYFRARVGDPKRVILWGPSSGALAALRLIEEFPRSFDAVIGACATAAGIPRNQDRRLDFTLAYAVAFGWDEDAWGPLEDLRPGLNFVTDVYPRVQWPTPDGSNRGRWEFIRLVNGIGSDAFWKNDPMWGYPAFLMNMRWSTEQRQLQEAFAGGPVARIATTAIR